MFRGEWVGGLGKRCSCQISPMYLDVCGGEKAEHVQLIHPFCCHYTSSDLYYDNSRHCCTALPVSSGSFSFYLLVINPVGNLVDKVPPCMQGQLICFDPIQSSSVLLAHHSQEIFRRISLNNTFRGLTFWPKGWCTWRIHKLQICWD